MIDSHLHFFDAGWPGGVIWPLPEQSFFGRRLPSDYLNAMNTSPPNEVVLVETSSRAIGDQRLVQLANEHDLICGFIANLRPLEDGFSSRLADFAARPKFKGIRLRPIDAFDLNSPTLLRALEPLSATQFTLELGAKAPERIWQINALAARLSGVKVVVTHAGHPNITRNSIEPGWKCAMLALSERSNVTLKITPLAAFSKELKRCDRLEPQRAHLKFLLHSFGARRIVFGSNWPVSESLGAPDQLANELLELLDGDLSVFEELTERSARRLYQLV